MTENRKNDGRKKKNGSASALKIDKRDDGVAVLWIDVPGEKMNTLRGSLIDEFSERCAQLESDGDVAAVVLASAKPSGFVAGADIAMLRRVHSASEGEALSRAGQAAMNRIERLSKPVVAAIHGSCLGGGLELALACKGRVASSAKQTKLGVPEVKLGLLPGAGGTQRLPRLIGLQGALDLMLTGRNLDAKRARRAGLVDEVVANGILIQTACERALALADPKRGAPQRTAGLAGAALPLRAALNREALEERALSGTGLGRHIVFSQAEKRLRAKTHGNYPAPEEILYVVRTGLEKGMREGLEAEARAFGKLAVSAAARELTGIFIATQELKKDSGVDEPGVAARPVRKVGVLGGGLMGSGVAYVSVALANVPVRVKERDDASVMGGLSRVAELIQERVKRRRLSAFEASRLRMRVSGSTDYQGFEDATVVIEAVFEDLELKRRMLRDVEALSEQAPANHEIIFATNTSSIPVAEIAAECAHPERVIGMHYFSPVQKMPLLEIVKTPQTAPWVTATCVELGKRQGKTVIVVNDGVGFYTTRVLAPLLNEAALMLSEGVPIDEIDQAMVNFGFPVGPLKLSDEIGIDVCHKVGRIMLQAYGDRMAAPAAMDRLIADQRLGRKNGKGFYRYDDKGKGRRASGLAGLKRKLGVVRARGAEVDTAVYSTFNVEPQPNKLSAEEIAWRCTLRMVNESLRCFGEGVLRSARDGDIGAVMGIGFPPFRGGPFRLVHTEGPESTLERMRKLEQRHGKRFEPAPSLTRMVQRKETFYGANPAQPGEASSTVGLRDAPVVRA